MNRTTRIFIGSGLGVAAVAAIAVAVIYFTPLPDSGDAAISTARTPETLLDATNRTAPIAAPRPTEIALAEPDPRTAAPSAALSAAGSTSSGAPPPVPSENDTATVNTPTLAAPGVVDPGLQLYRNGLIPEAMAKWEEMAGAGDANAAYRLGVEYADGKPSSVTRDFAVARKWMELAAERGNARAIFDLGSYYEYGMGVSADLAKAFGYYLEAAKRGHAQGQYNAGNMLETGDGAALDEVEGLKWYLLAAEQGMGSVPLDDQGRLDHEAPDALAVLIARLTPEQVAEAKRRAGEFVPTSN